MRDRKALSKAEIVEAMRAAKPEFDAPPELASQVKAAVGATTREIAQPPRHWKWLPALRIAGAATVIGCALLVWRWAGGPPVPTGTRLLPGPTVARVESGAVADRSHGVAPVRAGTTAPVGPVIPSPSARQGEESRSVSRVGDERARGRDGRATIARLPKPPGEPFLAVIAVRQPAVAATGRALQVGDRLGVGGVRTGARGRLTLITRRGSEFTLNQNSDLQIAARDAATLRHGEIYCRSREHEIARVDTAAGAIHLLGTAIDAATTNNHKVAVTVLAGKVRLENAHGQAVIATGKRAVMLVSAAPTAGESVNTYVATAWYDSRDQVVSEFGEIAYMVSRGDGLLTEIWKMKADGSGKQRVKTYIYGGERSWLPGEGELLIRTTSIQWGRPDFRTREADARRSPWRWQDSRPQTIAGMFSIADDCTWLLDADSEQDTQLGQLVGHGSWGRGGLAVSPDGRRIALAGLYQPVAAAAMPQEEGLWLYDQRSAQVRRMLDGYVGNLVAWAPDSRRLVVTSPRDARPVVMVDSDTGEVTRLEIWGAAAAFAPNGRSLAYCGDPQRTGAPHVDLLPTSICVMDLASREVRRPGATGGVPRWPRWSPDGARLAYSVDGPGAGVFVVRADGSAGARRIHGSGTAVGWTPAGDCVYVQDNDTLLLVGADGSGVRADLGGSATDSVLNPAERAQTAAAIEAIREAVFQYAVGNVRHFERRADEARAAFRASADVFAGLMWRYPLAKLSANEILPYADRAAALAAGTVKPAPEIGWEILDDPASVCMRNLHQLVYGLLLCAKDFDGVLLPTQLGAPGEFREWLWPWVARGPNDVFVDPITNRPYRANPGLAGRKLADMSDISTTVAFYEDAPWSDGARGVAFLDGHVRRVTAAEWQALAKAANLP